MDAEAEGTLYMYLGMTYFCSIGLDATPRQCLLMGGIIYQNYFV